LKSLFHLAALGLCLPHGVAPSADRSVYALAGGALPRSIETSAGTIRIGPALVRDLEAEIELVNNTSDDSGPLQVFVALPEDNERQRITDLDVHPDPAEVRIDEHGNAIARLDVPSLAPHEKRVVGWKATVEVHSVRHVVDPAKLRPLDEVPKEIRDLYLRDGAMYGIGSPEVRKALAEAVGDETDLYRRVLAIHDYLTRKLSYDRDSRWDPAPEVLRTGLASCSEYHFAFAALCRAAGIPVRWAGGSTFQGDETWRDTVWHRWSEVYLPGHGWFPIDVTWDDAGDGPRDDRKYFGYTAARFAFLTRGDLGDDHPLRWHYIAGVRGRSLKGGVSFAMTWTRHPESGAVAVDAAASGAAAELAR